MIYLDKILREQLLLEDNRDASIGNALAKATSASSDFSKDFNISTKKEVYRLQGRIIVSSLGFPKSIDYFNNTRFRLYTNNGGTKKIYANSFDIYFYSDASYLGTDKKSYTMMRRYKSYYSPGNAIVIDDKDFDDMILKGIGSYSFNDRVIPLDFKATQELPLHNNLFAMYNIKTPGGNYTVKNSLAGPLNSLMGGIYFFINDIVKDFQEV